MERMESELANYYFKPKSIWESIPMAVFKEFKANSVIIKISKGEMVYNEGAYPRGLYIINKGSAKLYLISNEGKEHVIYMLTRNEMFGYRPLLCNDNSPVFISAMEDCEIELIDKDVFLACMHKYSELSDLFFYYFGNEFRIMCYKASVFSLKSVNERVALTLLILNHKFNSNNDSSLATINRKDMANYAGITVETLSRQLKKLKNLNAISIKGWEIRLINLDVLFKIANI